MRAMLLIAGLLLAGPALADTKDGIAAWERGDYRTAIEQWRTAAGNGDTDAMFNLGQAYKMGRGVPADLGKAQDYFRQAAAKGHDMAADNYGLALFQSGRPRDAIPYLEKASARGDARAQYLLGTMLFNGADVKKDWVRAYALLTRSNRSGLLQAKTAVAQMDQHIPADQRRKGMAMADRMAPPPANPAVLAGGPVGGSLAVRSFDPPPSRTPDRAGATTPVAPVAPPPAAAPPSAAPVLGGWRLQLGAFGDSGNARRLGEQMGPRFPGRTVEYSSVGALTKVLVGPYPSRAAAVAACGALKPCVPVER